MATFILAWIVTYLLHSTLLVLGAWLLDKHWHDRPERMSAVWKTALVGGVLTASMQVGLGIAPVGGQWELSSPVAEASPPKVEEVQEVVTVTSSLREKRWLEGPTLTL